MVFMVARIPARRRIARALDLHRPAEEPVHRQPLRGGLEDGSRDAALAWEAMKGRSALRGSKASLTPRSPGPEGRRQGSDPSDRVAASAEGKGLHQPAHGEDQRDRSRESWSEAKGLGAPRFRTAPTPIRGETGRADPPAR